MSAPDLIPIACSCRFPGSGETTVLNRLLKRRGMKRRRRDRQRVGEVGLDLLAINGGQLRAARRA